MRIPDDRIQKVPGILLDNATSFFGWWWWWRGVGYGGVEDFHIDVGVGNWLSRNPLPIGSQRSTSFYTTVGIRTNKLRKVIFFFLKRLLFTCKPLKGSAWCWIGWGTSCWHTYSCQNFVTGNGRGDQATTPARFRNTQNHNEWTLLLIFKKNNMKVIYLDEIL
jgi:hypothetical protein